MQKLFENWRGFINEEQLSDSEFLQNIKSGDQVLRGKFQEEGIQLCSQVTKQSHPDRGDYTPSCSNEWSKIIDLDNFIKDFAEAGADIITFHPEATPDTSNTIKLIKKENKKVGISLKPKSKIELIEEHLEHVDLILIMSVEPGFGGQKFMPEVLEKIKNLKELLLKKDLNIDIEVDGGINFENCSRAKEAGANILVSGSTIFKENKGDLKKNIEILRNN